MTSTPEFWFVRVHLRGEARGPLRGLCLFFHPFPLRPRVPILLLFGGGGGRSKAPQNKGLKTADLSSPQPCRPQGRDQRRWAETGPPEGPRALRSPSLPLPASVAAPLLLVLRQTSPCPPPREDPCAYI